MCQEIYAIIAKRNVALHDLLLMFLYVEVLAMVGVYYDSKRIPITLPTTLSRLQQSRVYPFSRVRREPPINLIFEAGAILILAFASVVINYRRNKDDGHPSE